jgi:hypothetical protein
MSNHAKLILAISLAIIGYAIYVLTSDEIGSLEAVRTAGEINQSVQVLVDHSKDFERDRNNNIISFYVKDMQNVEAKVKLGEPAPEDVITAEVVKLLGHMHGNIFIAKQVSIVK